MHDKHHKQFAKKIEQTWKQTGIISDFVFAICQKKKGVFNSHEYVKQ